MRAESQGTVGDNGVYLDPDDVLQRVLPNIRRKLNGTPEVPVRPAEATEPAEGTDTPQPVFNVTEAHTADGHHHPQPTEDE